MAEFSNTFLDDGNSFQNHHHNLSSDLSTDWALRIIDQMLMEEDMDDETHRLQESPDFQAKERSFYELLDQQPPARSSQSEGDEATKFLPSTNMLQQGSAKESEYIGTDHDAVVTRTSHDEFDSWTCVDAGTCDKFAAYITDLKNASKAQLKQRTGLQRSVDLSSLLMSCAQAAAVYDQPGANECIRQIKLHSSQFGDANQRVAHYMVRGLEARLDGRTGSWMQKTFAYDKMSASDYFKTYCTSLISSSFRRISIFASNKLIATRSKKFRRVHIIDFGILYGFQWPAFIQRIAEREGGPPKLRITGVDFPQSGYDPAERIKATGSRLVHYAEMFGVPFEYNGIAQSWESIRVEDLRIEEGEFVAVNCLFRSENLEPAEALVSGSPRSNVLELIRKMNPNIFVHAVANGGYGVPYFITRFREALFYFSTLFDMIETMIPKERPERMLLENMLGNVAMNAIACEGADRVEKPETSSQWHLRHVRAGLKQVHFKRELLGAILNKVRSCYHKEFVVVEENKWLTMSWKGRIICALACWKPGAS